MLPIYSTVLVFLCASILCSGFQVRLVGLVGLRQRAGFSDESALWFSRESEVSGSERVGWALDFQWRASEAPVKIVYEMVLFSIKVVEIHHRIRHIIS
jgi:hypothetical protein